MSAVEGLRIGILEPDRFSEQVKQQISELGPVSCFDGHDLVGFLSDLNVLFVRLGYRIDDLFLNNCKKLQYLCSPTTGHNHIDEAALERRKVKLISLRGERKFLETIRATPEHTFGLILALLRHYKLAMTHVDNGEWDRDKLRGEELFGQSVGIIGLGRVGYRVASYCEAFGAKIVYCDSKSVLAKSSWQDLKTIDAVIAASRIVVLCASYRNGMKPILGESEVALLKGRYFVNTARGELVDERALFHIIEKEQILGVATDVIARETGANQLQRWRIRAGAHANVIVTPHIAGATVTSMARTEQFIAGRLHECVGETYVP